MARVTVVGRHDLTDAQWAVLEPLLPAGRRPGRPSTWTRRQLIDGIRWRTWVGTPCRDVPERYGSWSAAYALFRRWQCDGTWARVLTALQALADAAGLITWDVSVDLHGGSGAPARRRGARKGDLHAEPPGGARHEPAIMRWVFPALLAGGHPDRLRA